MRAGPLARLVDALDFGLLHELFRDPRASYDALGARVGLSGNAVKARLRRMESEGVLKGFLALPEPGLLGLREGLLVFSGVEDLDEREEEVLGGLADVPGVRAAEASMDHSVYVWVLHRDEEDWERIERAAISLTGRPPAWRVASEAPPADDARPAPADLRILRALLADGRRSAKSLARAAGLTFKPLKRRLAALLRDGRVRIEPTLSPAEAHGVVLFRVLLLLAPDADLAATRRLLPADAVATVEAGRVVSVLLQRPNLRAAREMLRALRALPGVEHAFLQVATHRASCGWLEEALARRLEAVAARPDRPAAEPPVPVPRSGR